MGVNSIGHFFSMGPIRGYKKKRKIDKKIEQIDLASGSSEEGSVDWWEEFSKRIAGICFFFRFLLV